MAWAISADVEEFTQAVEAFRKRVPVTRELARKVNGFSHARGFTIAGVAQLEVVQQVHDSIAEAIRKGTPFEEWRKTIEPKLKAAWGRKDSHRIETIFRNATMQAYNAGRREQMLDPSVVKFRPFWMFDGVDDKRITPICKECDGTILPYDDPWWNDHTPQLHHRCFPPGTLVATANGHKPIETLRVGDTVLTHRGRFRPVTEVMRSPSPQRLIQLRFASGRKLTATASHPALTQRGWTPLTEVNLGDRLVYASKVAALDASVGDSERYEASSYDQARSVCGETLEKLGALDANALLGQHEVNEDHSVAYHERLIEFVAPAAALQPDSEHRFNAGRLHACLRVRSRILEKLAMSARGRSRQHIPLQESATGPQLRRYRSQPRVRFFAQPERPVLATFGALQESADICDTTRIPGPLVRDRSGTAPHWNAILFEQGARGLQAVTAQCTHGLPQRQTLDDVQVSQDFGESLAMLSQQPGLECHLEIVTGHTWIDSVADRVFNLSVEEDESYVADGFVVHNCRSSVRNMRVTDAQRRGITQVPPATQAEEGFGGPPGVGEPWKPDLSKYSQPLRQEFQGKLVELQAAPTTTLDPTAVLRLKARELYSALELKDGGRDARNLLREQIQESFPGAVPRNLDGAAVLETATRLTDPALAGANGYYEVNGSARPGRMVIERQRVTLSRDAAERLAAGELGEKQIALLDSLRTLLHEEMHGHSRAAPATIRNKVTLALEEVGTELSARKVLADLVPTLSQERLKELKVGSYQQEIDSVVDVVRQATGETTTEITERILGAHYRSSLTKRGHWTNSDEALDAFVDGLEVSPDQAQDIRTDLRYTF